MIGYKQIKVSDDSPVSCNVSNDCVDDWVEGAKPREWWVVVDCQGGLSGDGTRLDQEQAERIAEYDNHHPSMDLKPYRAIKVREIIE
ncbi:MAG: hypothetical protein IPJ03_16045 [Ignavibacteriales bacterium]|nr:hypothetical protein [Ignavibacteriales bacterium]